ncbi:hypothetical protein LTR56_011426 [Elasticomyces elasticus]|nr:hypothetical protein LTR56_011426 [Elasticomyces elasticus]KAK3655980.1 hypothetical protein LTR22_009989 [Elasticomyces elasticus]KAK4921480.1 hypothetical protein LTR49_011134 [Elasticomyces elasticus]KAK5760049.1 hypothetical protein LTS12_009780 [Elasticomyces elasticus]
MATSIKYPVLDAEQRQVRLLSFKFNERREILGHFTVVSLDQRPQYTALSYVWGSEPPNRLIWIDSQPFGVRPNLFAYMQLAAAEPTIGEGMFIDAICINQNDILEKINQVALMGSLYELASEVIVWFGANYHWVPWLVTKHPAIVDPVVLRSCLLREPSARLTIEDAEEVRNEVRDRLVYHVYWSRIWTAQEYLLSKQLTLRTGILILDDMSLCAQVEGLFPKDLFSTLVEENSMSARVTASSASRVGLQSEQGALKVNFIGCSNFALGRISYGDPGIPDKRFLYRAILHFSEQKCSLPRDRIFGLLGLCRSGIVPDYSTPMIRLYVQALFVGLRELRSQYENADHEIRLTSVFVAGLLSCLGLRLDHPAVFLVTHMAFDPTLEATGRSIKYVFRVNMDLWHSQLNELLQCEELLTLVSGLQFKAATPIFLRILNGKGQVPALDGESRTLIEWLVYVDEVLWDLKKSQKRSDGRIDGREALAIHPRWQVVYNYWSDRDCSKDTGNA